MSRTVALALLMLLACREPTPSSARGLDHLDLSQNSRAVQFFRGFDGRVEGCPGCVLVEILIGDQREAYFVEPSPSCELEEAHVSRAAGGPSSESFGVYLLLNEGGMRELGKCARRAPEGDLLGAEFLIVLGGRFIDTVRIDEGELRDDFLLLVGPLELQAVLEALAPDEVPSADI
jgi:hypothetical protein